METFVIQIKEMTRQERRFNERQKAKHGFSPEVSNNGEGKVNFFISLMSVNSPYVHALAIDIDHLMKYGVYNDVKQYATESMVAKMLRDKVYDRSKEDLDVFNILLASMIINTGALNQTRKLGFNSLSIILDEKKENVRGTMVCKPRLSKNFEDFKNNWDK